MKKRAKFILVMLAALMAILPINTSAEEAETPAANQAQPARRLSEVLEYRDVSSKTYQLADGSYEWVGYTENIHYIDGKGKYQDISNAVVPESFETKEAEYQYKNQANSFSVRFGDISNLNAYPVSISYKGKSVSFAPKGAKASAVAKTEKAPGKILPEYISDIDSCVTYKDILPDTDMMYEIKSYGIKEYIILNQPSGINEFVFDLNLSGLKALQQEQGVVFTDENGYPIMQIGQLFAVDNDGAETTDVKCFIEENQLRIIVDEGYLADKSRVYPVVIDPSVMITGASVTFDSYVSSKLDTRNFYLESYLRTGKDEPYEARRTYIKFTLPTNVPPAAITNAYLRLEKSSGVNPVAKAYRVTGNWQSDTINWNNKPGYTTPESGYAYNDSGSWWRMTSTELVKKWLDGTYNNYGFCVRDDRDLQSSTANWTTFYSSDKSSPHKPELHIVYNSTTYFNITYNGNGNTGGSAPASQWILPGQSAALRLNTGNLTKTGSVLLGWNTNSAGTGTDYSLGQIITPYSNLTLYAKWSSPSYYNITYNGNGNTGGSAPASQSVLPGQSVTLRTNTGNLTKSGCTLLGWNTNSAGTGTSYSLGQAITPTSNLTLYAKWGHTISYNGNGNTGGSAPASQSVTVGQSIVLRTNTGNLTKTGYILSGWNTNSAGTGTDYSLGQTITPVSDLTLYAKWSSIPTGPTSSITSGWSYMLKNDSGYFMDVYNNQTTVGTSVIQWAYHAAINQKFFINYQESGEYIIRIGASSDRYVAVDGSGNVVLASSSTAATSRWYIIISGSNYRIVNKSDITKFLGAPSGTGNLFLTSSTSYATWSLAHYDALSAHGGLANRTVSIQRVGSTTSNTTWLPRINNAVSAWNNSGSGTSISTTTSSSPHKIEVRAEPEDTSYGWCDKNPEGNVVATSSYIVINTLTIGASDNFRQSTIAHEIGHLLWLSDNPRVTTANSSLMHGSRDREVIFVPQLYDINNVNFRYN